VNPWVDVEAVWASVRPGGSGERFLTAADQMQASISHTVRMRWRAGLGPKLRLLWDGKFLGIQSVVDPDGRKRELVALCLEIVESP
jgi:SPP1 family predicted phage head-tail adaptor